MQKHCIEVAKNAIDTLNPGQVIVDTSKPARLCSFETITANVSLGPGKHLPFFSGLHIEKLLLEIHRQLIAGLAQFLDQAKVSNTGGGNVVINVSQITGARHLLQVSLCAECKVMRVIFDSAESTDDIQDWMEKKSSESPHLPLLENNI